MLEYDPRDPSQQQTGIPFDLLRRVREERGMSVLFISHDLAVIAELCDRVAVMQLGRIVEEGPTARVLGEPEDDYTKRLVAAVPKIGVQA